MKSTVTPINGRRDKLETELYADKLRAERDLARREIRYIRERRDRRVEALETLERLQLPITVTAFIAGGALGVALGRLLA